MLSLLILFQTDWDTSQAAMLTSRKALKNIKYINTETVLASRLDHTCRSVMETLWDSTVGRRGKRGDEWGDVMGE